MSRPKSPPSSTRIEARRAIQRTVALLAAVSVPALSAHAIVTTPSLVDGVHGATGRARADQNSFLRLVVTGQGQQAFEAAFETGDELFEDRFNAVDGVGANVGKGQRFTHVPRADLAGPGEWRNHVPQRATGPNAESCNACHRQPSDDGAGGADSNVHRDPTMSGQIGSFIQRNTPHTFGLGALQCLAEEMTAELQHQREHAIDVCCASGQTQTVVLKAKGISFGQLVVAKTGSNPCATSVNTQGVRGVASDLVVRPYQWKGSIGFIRAFNRDAAHNEIGMQPVELTGAGVDGDFDGVTDEFSVGDITALSVYLAAQPRPTSKLELDALHLLDEPLSNTQVLSIRRGEQQFATMGCAVCHVPKFELHSPVFREPSRSSDYRDSIFPSGQNPIAAGVDPAHPIAFDLTKDQPDNRVTDTAGNLVYHLGALRKNASGRAIVELYGDLKRHDMGAGLAESIDEVGTGASVFLTENLWGVGSTAPYLHDGRATTVTEAILEHGGEASPAKNAFVNASLSEQRALVAFLENLVLYKLEVP